MKKIRLLLALFAVSIGALQGAWARTAPTFPEAQTLESGKTYYMYNVGSDRFVYRSDNDVKADATTRTGIVITGKEDGTYTMQFSDNNYYIWTSSSDMRTQSGIDADVYFRIAEVENGYTIQRNRNYDETNFVANNNEYYVYANQTSGNIVWQLFDKIETDYYYAKKALYDALEAAEVNYAWAIADFEAIYANEASTTEELNVAATTLNNSLGMSKGYQAPWWNERPILFSTADGSFGQSYNYTWALPDNNWTCGTYFIRYLGKQDESSSISATVMVEESSTLVYSLYGTPPSLDIYVDGDLTRSLIEHQCKRYIGDEDTRFFEKLEPGLHTITWTLTGTGILELKMVGVMANPQITVSLLEPGSLGTEVLYNTDHIKNVRSLKVKGTMNDDDWAKIKMMSTLQELDLSEAQITEIPENQFRIYPSLNDTTMAFLHKIVLPEGLIKINSEAFYASYVEDINFPTTLQSIGSQAFCMSHVKEVIMGNNVTEIGEQVFSDAHWLKKAKLSDNLNTIPYRAFDCCYYLNDLVLPNNLKTIKQRALRYCHRINPILPNGLQNIGNYALEGCTSFNQKIPETVTFIDEAAFNTCNGMDSLVIPSSVTSIGLYAFCNCQNLKYAELSVQQYKTPNGIFDNTPKLETIKLNSATVVVPTIDHNVYPHRNITQLTLKVPHYLVNEYKLHSYWYNAKAIEPFDYSDVEYIPIHGNLTLNHERFGGQPSIEVYDNNYLKINGNDPQQFTNITVRTQNYGNNHYYSQLLNNSNQVTASGDVMVDYRTDGKKWYFVSLPFDLDVSRISHNTSGVQYAIRYYDGAGRAANGKSGNWKNVDRTGIVPAGTGFIYQTNIDTWTYFYAADTDNKYSILTTEGINKTLAVNASETASDKGWNLVGNPYQCYYNNHCLNFTAPITVWDVNNKTYTAYSLTDDDYAIRPNEAFFVQCPNEEHTTLGFPLQGRQLTDVVESQNAARQMAPQTYSRKVVNLIVSNGELEDMTRVVLNEQANLGYEVNCDASKFMSMEGGVPQIYTLDADGTQYAINERPLDDGTVMLGFYAGQAGNYTLTLNRCDAGKVFLTDRLTGMTTELAADATYRFSAEAGYDNTRFVLSFVSGESTGIQETDKDTMPSQTEIFSTDGKLLGTDASRLNAGIYIVRQGKKISKIVVR